MFNTYWGAAGPQADGDRKLPVQEMMLPALSQKTWQTNEKIYEEAKYLER
jgi:hypothetical protein